MSERQDVPVWERRTAEDEAYEAKVSTREGFLEECAEECWDADGTFFPL